MSTRRVRTALSIDPAAQRREALELQQTCGLTDAQTETLATLSLTRYERLCAIVAASNASSEAMARFLDRCAQEPQGVVITFPGTEQRTAVPS